MSQPYTSPYALPTWSHGFGTWPLNGEELVQAVGTALELGFRAIDTAQLYGNEAAVGEALRHTKVPRNQILVTTKIAPDNTKAEAFWPSLEASLKALNCDQIDSLLLHWPHPQGNNDEALALLQEAHARGLARNIGVSNYTIAMLRAAQDQLEVPLACNQVEFHPLVDQGKLRTAAAYMGVQLTAFSAVARGQALNDPTILTIAEEANISPAQVTLSWILAKGLAFNAMSTKPENMAKNLAADAALLTAEQVARIDTLGPKHKLRLVDRPRIPYAPIWD